MEGKDRFADNGPERFPLRRLSLSAMLSIQFQPVWATATNRRRGCFWE
jgi:hypothetical protein